MFQVYLKYCIFILCIIGAIAPPPRNVKVEKEPVKDESAERDEFEYSHFHPYLSKVIELINQDVHGREWLSKLDEASIMLGNFTHDFKLNATYILDQLNMLKAEELHRLNEIRRKGGDVPHDLDHHLDNKHKSFEKSDLLLLLQKALMDIDKQRKETFKRYEMEKEHERRQKMKGMSPEEKAKFEAEEKAKKKHEPMHHPGSRQQLEDVWEGSDHMEKDEFNPKVFFALHDMNGDKYWDEEEIEALFEKELAKKYPDNAPVDEVEKNEERERMREHVSNELDIDKDGRVSREEFLTKAGSPEFNEDSEVDELDEDQFTEDEYNDLGQRLDWDKPENVQTMHIDQLQHQNGTSPDQVHDNIGNAVDRNNPPVNANSQAASPLLSTPYRH